MSGATFSAREMLDRLVAFPTVSSDSNLDLIDFAEDYLRSHGVAPRRVWNAERTKAALFAKLWIVSFLRESRVYVLGF